MPCVIYYTIAIAVLYIGHYPVGRRITVDPLRRITGLFHKQTSLVKNALQRAQVLFYRFPYFHSLLRIIFCKCK